MSPRKGSRSWGTCRQPFKTGTAWQDNTIQFPRFIAEADAAGAFTQEILRYMADGMDLTGGEVHEILDRAQSQWEIVKTRIFQRCAPKIRTKDRVQMIVKGRRQ